MKLGSSIIIQGHNSFPNFENILLGSLFYNSLLDILTLSELVYRVQQQEAKYENEYQIFLIMY